MFVVLVVDLAVGLVFLAQGFDALRADYGLAFFIKEFTFADFF